MNTPENQGAAHARGAFRLRAPHLAAAACLLLLSTAACVPEVAEDEATAAETLERSAIGASQQALRASPEPIIDDPVVAPPRPAPEKPPPVEPVIAPERPAPTTFDFSLRLRDLGEMGARGVAVHRMRLNEKGAVIWNAHDHAYVYQDCRSREVGPGPAAVATDINDYGTVVGSWLGLTGRRGFMASEGQSWDITGETELNVWRSPTALNGWDIVVGDELVVALGERAAVRFRGNATVRFGATAGCENVTRVVDITDNGFVLGKEESGQVVRPTLSKDYGCHWTPVSALFTVRTFPTAINAAGDFVGWYEAESYFHAFVKRAHGPMLDIGTFGGGFSRAYDINDMGWVVGTADVDATGPDQRAFVLDGHALIDLNTRLLDAPGWLLLEAHSINESGQIAALAFYQDRYHAVLLTPDQPGKSYASDPCLVQPVFQAR